MVLISESATGLDRNDRYRLAELHASSLDQGFMTSLGPRFLQRLYGAFASHRATRLYLARDDRDDIVGLAVVSRDMRSLYLHFLLHDGLAVLPRVLVRVFTWRTAVAVWETLSYPFRRHAAFNLGSCELELINFCVDDRLRRQGVGRQLLDRVLRDFAAEGGGRLRIVTGGHQVEAHALYIGLGARPVGEINVHRDSPSRVFDLDVGEAR